MLGSCRVAERTRFELVDRIAPVVGLANRWFQPLTHLSMMVYVKERSRSLVVQSYNVIPNLPNVLENIFTIISDMESLRHFLVLVLNCFDDLYYFC